MKKTLLTLGCLCAVTAIAQLSYVNTTTVHVTTNTVTGNLTAAGLGTNLPVSIVNTNYSLVGDTLAVAFGKVNADILYLQGEIVALEGSGGGGGGGGGFGYNPTVTNTVTLLYTNSVYYSVQTITLTNITGLVSCSGGTNFTLDTNPADETWGTLTNKCGDVFIVSEITTNGFLNTSIGDIFSSWNYGALTNVSFWKTNQVLSNFKAVVAGAGYTPDNGTYIPTYSSPIIASGIAPPPYYSDPGMASTHLTNSAGVSLGMDAWATFHSDAGIWQGWGLSDWDYYFGPYGVNGLSGILYFLAVKAPGLPMPLTFYSAGSGFSGAAAPAPTVTFSYTLAPGAPVRFIGDDLGVWFSGLSLVTNVTTNITYSGSFDWVLLKKNSGNSYTVTSYNPNGAFSWLTASNCATVCPAPPAYVGQNPVPGQWPCYFSVEAGANWSTVEWSWQAVGTSGTNYQFLPVTNMDCSCCPAIFQTLTVPPATNFEAITTASFTTNFAAVTLASSPNSTLLANSQPVALQSAATRNGSQIAGLLSQTHAYLTNPISSLHFMPQPSAPPFTVIGVTNQIFMWVSNNAPPTTFGSYYDAATNLQTKWTQ